MRRPWTLDEGTSQACRVRYARWMATRAALGHSPSSAERRMHAIASLMSTSSDHGTDAEHRRRTDGARVIVSDHREARSKVTGFAAGAPMRRRLAVKRADGVTELDSAHARDRRRRRSST